MSDELGISNIHISNFKSFKDLDVELGDFNVVIGANASGKSNFIEVFKFLRDISMDGLDNAISMQGGVEFLPNLNIGSSRILDVEATWEINRGRVKDVNNKLIGIKLNDVCYTFNLNFQNDNYHLEKDVAKYRWNFHKMANEDDEIKEKEYLGKTSGTIRINKNTNEFEYNAEIPKNIPIKKEDLFVPIIGEKIDTLFLQHPLFGIMLLFENIWDRLAIYDFDPKKSRRATPISGESYLKEDGSNLAIVLRGIEKDIDKTKKLLNLLQDVLPFIKDIGIQKFIDKSLMLSIREFYTNKDLPAFLMSEGTINILMYIIALYFEEDIVTIIEEPERHIHPSLIAKLVEMMKDASRNRQVIITTHNPEILKHVNLKDILLVSRDKQGFSQITRPGTKEEIKTFLENEIGIEELFVDNMLEVLK